MRSRGKAAASWRILLSVLALVSTTVLPVAAKDYAPTITASKLPHSPAGLSYFEDSNNIVYHDLAESSLYLSKDAGASWNIVKDVPAGKVALLIMHEFDPKRAYVITEGLTHYKTEDRGESWSKWESGAAASAFRDDILHFHAGDPDRILFMAMDCAGIFCEELVVYSTDGFKNAKFLRSNTAGCWWAKSSLAFSTGQTALDKDRILCIVRDPFSPFKEDQRLVVSDDFFKTVDGDKIQEFEPDLDTNRGVRGIVNLAIVKKFLLVATTSQNTAEMALFVTDDTLKWHRAMFPNDHGHKIHQEAYTVLESTNYSIQIDVMTTRPSDPMGVMFTSNSNGTFFTENKEHTNRNQRGHVDFERINNIQGVFLLNSVANADDVENHARTKKKVVSQITFDDGRTFQSLKADGKTLHLHSVTDIDNIGRVFSSPAPGMVMGIGNTGDHLTKFEEGDLYVSDDAGEHWWKALDGPHKYEFGDQGSILVAVKDSENADVGEVSYSIDHGKTWKSVAFPDKLRIYPDFITTTQDSTSMKFLLIGRAGTPSEPKPYSVAIDFAGLHERKCGSGDMEDWHARVGEDGKPTCVMGHKQTYSRRKKDADCFIQEDWKDPVPTIEICECTDQDFECDYNFDKDENGKCVQRGPLADAEGACKNAKPEDTFKGTSGYRLIPGNTCKGGVSKDEKVDRKCSEIVAPPKAPASGKITATQHVFETKMHNMEKHYLERGDSRSDDDEIIIVRPVNYNADGSLSVEDKIWRTTDHGKKWDQILKGEEVRAIIPHTYFKDFVFFTTKSDKVIYTVDHGRTFHHFTAPMKPGHVLPLAFHPDKKDWLIWLGENCDKDDGKKNCVPEASLSLDRGDNWRTIVRFATKCDFTGHSAYKWRDVKQIVCLAHKEDDPSGPKTIVSSNDFFVEDKKFPESNVKDFAMMAEFIVVAAEGDKGLKAMGSLDGEDYAPAHFPPNFKVDHQNEYTVLDSSTHAVNLFVATETKEGHRYGSILKSNSNGTSFVLSISGVNCNDRYYVDFEKIPGLEGLTVVNTVANRDKLSEPKQLQTKITHNDGAEWGFLPPPGKDLSGKSYDCSSNKGDEKCALHLHHYTERQDKRKTFSADTAVGIMFGVGNIGPSLGSLKDADTFMTTDAGISWQNVKKGNWVWQYGDQGSLTVLVQRSTPDTPVKTKIVSYSTDAGKTFRDFEFTDSEVSVLDITTLQSGSSRNFLLWCKNDKGDLFSVNLDFDGLFDRPCVAKENENGDSDYILWSPKHPSLADDCLFGHVTQYRRKKPGQTCYNDKRVDHLYMVSNCTCTRSDYECAYNFEMALDGQCALVDGKEPLSLQEWCKQNPEADTFYEPTGYRRIPLTTCQGGVEFDKSQNKQACTNHEEEFERKNGISGVAVFFAVVIPVGLAASAGWWVWRNWEGKFGQIRLGEQRPFDNDAPWVKYPVIAVSAVVALVAALPLVVASLWRLATSTYQRVSGGSGGGGGSWMSRGPRRFTTRDSFARGAADYAIVDDDEGELLGDDSDEEV